MSQLVTGEAVALDLGLAALPSRAVARGIDGAAQLLGFFLLSLLLEAIASDASGAAAAALGIIVVVLVLVGYPVAFEALTRGRTPGKMALGLRVVRDDGGPIAFRQAFVRGLTGLVDLGTLFVPSIVLMLVGERSKRLGDLVAGTVVIQERISVQGGPVATMPPPLAGWAPSLELSRLSDELALSVRQFISRSGQMTPASREDVGARLVAAVQAVTAPPPPPGTPGWAYLSAVLAERRRREELRLAALAPSDPGTGPGARAATPSYVPPPSYGPAPSYAARPGEPTPAPQRDGFAIPS